MNSNVVLINQTTGYLMIDIVNAYCLSYDNVSLIAGTVQEYDRKLLNKVKREYIIPYNKKNILKRVMTWSISTIQIFFILFFKYRKSLIIYATNPPSSYFISLFLKNRFAIIEYDIYPNALKNIGIEQNNLIYKLWNRINYRVFNKAECIFTLSKGMKDLLTQYVDQKKIRVIPNWSSINYSNPIARNNNEFIKEHKLNEKFIIMYSGNIGYTHNVEIILDLAKYLKDSTEFHFVIIGDGGKKSYMINYAKRLHLNNCTFLDWQPSSKIASSLSAANLSIVTLTEDAAHVSVPSKTYNILSVGCPLLCIAPHQSEISLLVEKEKCGRCFQKKDIDEMSAYIQQLKKNMDYWENLSVNALKAAKHYTYKNASMYVIK